MACSCDEAAPEIYNTVDRVANKDHKCCECNKQINTGQKYRYISGKWEGDFRVFKMCETCSDIWDNLSAVGYCCMHEGLSEDYQEYLDSIHSNKHASEIMDIHYKGHPIEANTF